MEQKGAPLISKKDYILRVLKHVMFAVVLVVVSLLLGVAGYMKYAQIGFVDALLNASMILTGMGPVNVMATDQAKLFASFYAIYSGVVFLTITAIVITPIVHRILHKFHVGDEIE